VILPHLRADLPPSDYARADTDYFPLSPIRIYDSQAVRDFLSIEDIESSVFYACIGPRNLYTLFEVERARFLVNLPLSTRSLYLCNVRVLSLDLFSQTRLTCVSAAIIVYFRSPFLRFELDRLGPWLLCVVLDLADDVATGLSY